MGNLWFIADFRPSCDSLTHGALCKLCKLINFKPFYANYFITFNIMYVKVFKNYFFIYHDLKIPDKRVIDIFLFHLLTSELNAS